MLVGLPSGVIQITATWIYALGIRWTRSVRSFWGFGMTVVPLIGSILLLSLPKADNWGIVVATWLAACTSLLMLISTSMIASNVKGNTKKSVVSGIFFIGYTTGCICGPQLWQAVDAPRYVFALYDLPDERTQLMTLFFSIDTIKAVYQALSAGS